jgi:hypothetical protein
VRRSGLEERLGGLGDALVVGQGRELDRPVEVEDVDLLGVGGLRHDRLEDGPQALLGGGMGRGGRARVEVVTSVVTHARHAADEHDVAALLVDPAIERVRLDAGDRVEPLVQRLRQVACRPGIDDHADDRDRHERKQQERAHEPRPQAAAERPEQPRVHRAATRPYGTA